MKKYFVCYMHMQFDIHKYHFDSTNFFDGLSKDHSKLLKTHMKRLEEKKGNVIFRKGSYSKGVYILRKGKVKIYQTSSQGKTHILYIYMKSEFFGYRPILCNETHSATAEALDDCVISFIPQKIFKDVLKTSPELANKLLADLSHQFAVWVNTATAFAQMSVMQRTALALLILNEKFRIEKSKKPVILNLSREILANYVGTAIETLVRILKELKQKKIITVKGRRIKITRPHALVELTEIY